MSDSDSNLIVNNININDSSIYALKIHLEEDSKVNPEDRCIYVISEAISCVENLTEVSLKEAPFAFGERIMCKKSKKFLVQESQRRDRTKKNMYPKSMPILVEIIKNEVLLDDGEVTHVKDHLENVKTALRQKGQVETESASPVRKLEHMLRWTETL